MGVHTGISGKNFKRNAELMKNYIFFKETMINIQNSDKIKTRVAGFNESHMECERRGV